MVRRHDIHLATVGSCDRSVENFRFGYTLGNNRATQYSGINGLPSGLERTTDQTIRKYEYRGFRD